MTWGRPARGDRVVTLEDRLRGLERRTNILLVATTALLALHAQQVGPFFDWARAFAIGTAAALAGLV